jgi:putative MATE family efflux protein
LETTVLLIAQPRPARSHHHPLFTEGPIGRQLVEMTVPLVWGILAAMGAQVVITWCVGRLGVAELAAIGFAFPVVMIVVSLGIGFSAGTSAAVANDLGRGDRLGVAKLTTDAILIAGTGTILLAAIGILSIGPIFRSMGATDASLPLVTLYMRIWYLGAPFYIATMVALSALRAVGDARFQGYAMVAASALSALLAPLIILHSSRIGINGVAGAAFVGNAPWVITLVVAFFRLKHLDMLERAGLEPAQILRSLRRVLRVGLPAAMTNSIIPLAAAVITSFLARLGPEAVAGYGIATRFESMTLCVFLALSAVMNPYAGQNLGARRPERIHAALRLIVLFCLGWGALLAVVLGLSAHPLSGYFTTSPAVSRVATAYWHIVPISYGAAGIIMCVNALLNGMNRPMAAVIVSVSRVIVVNIPIAWLGARLFGAPGVFFGISIANFVVGFAATVWVARALRRDMSPATAAA